MSAMVLLGTKHSARLNQSQLKTGVRCESDVHNALPFDVHIKPNEGKWVNGLTAVRFCCAH